MIDTFTLKYLVSPSSVEQLILSADSSCFKEFAVFLAGEQDLLTSTRKLRSKYPGILSMYFYRSPIYESYGRVVMGITVAPHQLITGCSSGIDLYYASIENNNILEDAYANALYSIFPVLRSLPSPKQYGDPSADWESLPFLILGRPKRIDYTLDMVCDNPQLFLELAKATAFDSRKVKCSFNNNNVYLRNNTTRFYMYDKQEKMNQARYAWIPGIEETIYASDNIVRTEVSLKKFPKQNTDNIAAKYASPINIGITPYLSENAAKYYLDREYSHIGIQDWFNRNSFRSRLFKAKIRKDKNQKLIEAAEYISQNRSVTKAFNQCQQGYKLAKTGKALLFERNKLRDAISEIRKLGMQPLRIPDRRKEKHVKNPYQETKVIPRDYTPYRPKLVGGDLQTHLKYKKIQSELKQQYSSRRKCSEN